MFESSFMKYKERTALITETGKGITYRELDQLQKDMSHLICVEGLTLVVCTNTLESIVIYLACIQKHGTVMLEGNIREDQLKKLVEEYLPEVIFLPKKQFEERLALKGYRYLEMGMQDYICCKRLITGPQTYPELALLLTTSGSTGSPKHVRISYENLEKNTVAIIRSLGICKEDRTITSLEMSYSYGLSVINTFLMSGASIVLTDRRVYSAEFWKLAADKGVTSFSGVPSFYEMFFRFGIQQYVPDSLKVMTQAGGAMRNGLWDNMQEYAERHGIQFYVMYGQTEASPRISCLPWTDMKRKKGSAGLPLDGEKITIMSSAGKFAPAGEPGEILCEGENVGLGYAYSREDLSRTDDWNGILHTGDIGYLDCEGYLYLTGRKSGYAKVMGKRISLAELEEILREKCGVVCSCQETAGKIVLTGCNDTSVIKLLADITGINARMFECIR